MISRMRVLAMPRSVECADNVMGSIIETYFAPNRTLVDLRKLVMKGGGVDPLKNFSEAAREELQQFKCFEETVVVPPQGLSRHADHRPHRRHRLRPSV
jgi:hypothetical protein